MIPKHTIEEIKVRTDIVDLIGGFLPLKRGGGVFKACCPFHQEKTPSFTVNPTRQIYHCFGCGKGGDAFRFLMDHEGMDFITSVRWLAERAHVTIVEEGGSAAKNDEKTTLFKINEGAAHLFHSILKNNPEAEPARRYLQERKLDDELVTRFQLGFAPNKWDLFEDWGRKNKVSQEHIERAGLLVIKEQAEKKSVYDRFRNRLMIPIHDPLGRVIGFSGRILEKTEKAAKYVNSPETLIFHKNRVLFALDKARRGITEKKCAIICEGQIDAIRCHQGGFTNTVASQGTALSENHARMIKRYCDEVILVLDPDVAGQNAALKSYAIFLAAGLSVRIARLPDGEDPDSMICNQGADAFRAILDQAVPGLNYQMTLLSEREDKHSEAGLLRISKAVLETIQYAPSAIQKENLLHRASELLGISETALQADLQKAPVPRPSTPAPRPVQTAPNRLSAKRVPEEVALAELLLSHAPEACELIEDYLPLEEITDPICQTIIRECIAQKDTGVPPVISSHELAPEDLLPFTAKLQMGPNRLVGEDALPEYATKKMILTLRQKYFEKLRRQVREEMSKAPEAELNELQLQYSQLTEDIYYLRKGWDEAQSILQQ